MSFKMLSSGSSRLPGLKYPVVMELNVFGFLPIAA